MRRSLATTATVAAAALLLSACSSGDDTEASTAETPTPVVEQSPEPTLEPEATVEAEPAETSEPAPEPEPEPVAVPAVLDFTAPTVDGGTFEGASLAGQDAVLFFWAPWCPVCQREAPMLTDVAADFDGQVAVVGVAGLSSSLDDMKAFVANTGTDSLTHIADTEGSIYTRFGVASQTTYVFVNDDGSTETVTGTLGEDALSDRMQKLADA